MNSNNKILVFILMWLFLNCVINVFTAEILANDEGDTVSEENVNHGALDEDTDFGSYSPDVGETDFEIEAENEHNLDESEPQDQPQPEMNGANELLPGEKDDYTPSEEEYSESVGESDDGFPIIVNNGMMSSAVIDDENIVVYNFDELKAALSGSNRYVNVYLGADINMKALGIEIHSSKKRVLISGKNPLDGSGPFTINEYNSLDPGYTIRVISNSGVKEVIMKDIGVIGRNYYGAVCIYDGVSDVRVTFENVSYSGPQISYNRGGTVCITGDSDIRITGENGLSDAQELVEANGLELGGNTVINHYAPVMSGIWLVGSGSYIKVLPGANVTWNESGTYTIYQDNLNPADFTLEKGARFSINTINGLFYDSSTTLHQFGSVLIDSDAALEIRQQGSSSIPIMKVKNDIRVLENANLIILAQSAPCLLYITGAASFTAQSPNTLALYNKTNRLINWSDSSNHNISILSSFINYWSSPCDLPLLGGFDDSPAYRWHKKAGANLSIEITASSSATISVASNYQSEDWGEPPNEESLNIQNARIITAGRMFLELDVITDTSLYISGRTERHAELRATYTDINGIGHTAYGSADSGGAFDIRLENGNFPATDSTVVVCSSKDYKNVLETTIVTETPENALAFIHVPTDLVFPKTSITSKNETVPRADDVWHIIIEDTRSLGSKWDLFVRLKEPLTAEADDSEHKIENAVIFKNSDGSFAPLYETVVKAASGVKSGDTETAVGWPADEGIMLYIDTLKVFSGINYSAKIEWILADAP